MKKTYLDVVFLVTFTILINTISCTTNNVRNISGDYSQQEVSMLNMIVSVRQVIKMHREIYKSYYCGYMHGAPTSKSVSMINMLRLTESALVIINMWSSIRENYTISRDWCENIILFASMSDVYQLIKKINGTSTTDARIKLLAVMHEPAKSDYEAGKTANTITKFVWKYLRGYTIVLIPVDIRILIFQSEKHKSYKRCEPEIPKRMTYSINGTIINKNLTIFQHFNNNKCIVRLAAKNCWRLPGVINPSNNESILAIERKMMEIIAEDQNYTLEVINVESSSMNDQLEPELPESSNCNMNQIINKLESDEADIGACNLWIMYRPDVKYSYSYSATRIVLMIPLSNYIPFSSLLHTFGKPVWICIFFGWFVGRFLIRINRRSITSLDVLALFVGESPSFKPNGFIDKFQTILWVFYGYLITQSYIASLASVLNNPLIKKIETIEELVSSDIQIAGHGCHIKDFMADDKYNRIVESFIDMDAATYMKMIDNPDEFLSDIKNTGILIDNLLVNSRHWISKYYQMKERMLNIPVGMAVMSRSRLSLYQIDRTVISLVESGLLTKWTKDVFQKNYSYNGQQRSPALSLEEVSGIFSILIFGLSFSIIAFIFEIYKEKIPKIDYYHRKFFAN